MEEQLKQYLTEFVELLKQGGQFALEQMPEFIHEYLTYYAWYHGFLAVVCLAIVIVVWHVFFKARRIGMNNDDWDEEKSFVAGLVSVIVSAIPTISFFGNVFDFIKVTVAPRLYLIENLLNLINQS